MNNKLKLMVLAFVFIITGSLLPVESTRQAAAAENDVLPAPQIAAVSAGEHPRLFFSAADVQTLKNQANSTHSEIWQGLRDHVTGLLGTAVPAPNNSDQKFFRNQGDQLIAMAFVCRIGGDTNICNMAKTYHLAHVSWSQWDATGQRDLGLASMLMGNSLAYDWLYHLLSDSQRQTVRTKLAFFAGQMYEAGSTNDYVSAWNNWWSNSYMQNHAGTNFAALGITGLALLNEHSSAPTWINLAKDRWTRIGYLLNGNTDGTWHEGINYQSLSLTMGLPFLVNLRRIQGDDIIPHAYLQKFSTWRIYNYIPNSKQFILPFGDYDWSWADPRSANVLHFVANEYNDRTAQWLALFIGDIWSAPWTVFEFLYYDSGVSPLAPNNLPLSASFRNLEGVIWRSGWNAGDLIFGLRSGAYGGKFAYDKFMANAYPWDMSGSTLNAGHNHDDSLGFYIHYGGQWVAQEVVGYTNTASSAHNTILIDGQGQKRVLSSSSVPRNSARSDGYLEATFSTPNFDFVAADATRRYTNISGMSDVTRYVVYVRPGYFLMVDNLAASSSHTYEWIAHFGSSVSVSGNWVRGNAANNQVLGVQVVAPSAFSTTTGNDGKPYIRIRPSSPASNTRMVNLLYPTNTNGWGSRPNATSLGDNGKAVATQVQMNDGSSHKDIILMTYANQTSDTTVGSYRYDARMAVVSYKTNNALERLVVYGGTFVYLPSGQVLVSGLSSSEAFEANYQSNGVVALYGNVPDTMRLYAPNTTSLTVNGAVRSFIQNGDYITLNGSVIAGTDGSVTTSPSAILPGDTVTVRVTDGDLNESSSSVEQITVNVKSSKNEQENITLIETNASSGVFSGTVNTRFGANIGSNNDGIFNVVAGDKLTATYNDELTSLGNSAIRTSETTVGSLIIESDAAQVYREGTWTNQTASQASGGKYLSSSNNNSVLTVIFEGPFLEVLYTQGSNFGTLAIEVDSTVLRTVNTAGSSAYKVKATFDYLSDDTHILRVYPVSGNVHVDAFAISRPVNGAIPNAPALIAPTGTITATNPTFEWGAVANAEWYLLTITGPNGVVLTKWYDADVICNTVCRGTANLQLAQGSYTWKVQVQNMAGYKASSTMSFAVSLFGNVTQIAPNGTLDDHDGIFNFQWNRISNAEWYQINVKNTSNNAVVLDQWVSAANCPSNPCTMTSQSALPKGDYAWIIRAYGSNSYGPWSNAMAFTIAPALPGVITKVAPTQGSTVNSLTVTFKWTHNAKATGYTLWAGGATENTGGLNLRVGSDVNCPSNQCSYTTTLTETGEWTWYIAGFNVGGIGPWSAQNSAADNWGAVTFTVDVPLPSVVSKIAPANNAELTSGVAEFRWQQATNTTSYQLYVLGPNGFEDYREWDGNCINNTCSAIIALPTNGDYQWYARGLNSAGGGAWSTANDASDNWGRVDFKLNASSAEAIQKISPLSGGNITTSEVPFKWQGDSSAIRYEFYVSGDNGFVSYRSLLVGRDITCPSNVCTLSIAVTGNGSHTWYVRAISPAGPGPWSLQNNAEDNWGATTFNVNVPSAGAVTKISPTEGANSNNVSVNLAWNKEANSTAYEIYITGPNGYIYNGLSTSDCPNNVCGLALNLPYTGTYTWYLRGIWAFGYGPWSVSDDASDNWGARSFSMTPTAPSTNITLQAPANGAILNQSGNQVEFRWQSVQNATWYAVVVAKATGEKLSESWYSMETVGCEDGECSVTQSLDLGSYRWTVLVWGPGSTSLLPYQPGVTPTNSFSKVSNP